MGRAVRAARFLGPVLFVGGVAALAVAFLQDQATLNLFLVFPVITALGPWAFLGVLLVAAGFASFLFSWPLREETLPEPPQAPAATVPPGVSPTASSRRWGGVVFLGPIPIVFGSDAKVTQWMLLAGVVLFVALLVLTLIALQVI
ncbi:MAG: DUF131 domain-containing protein [Candidatus Thermoplasmatota archaeon]